MSARRPDRRRHGRGGPVPGRSGWSGPLDRRPPGRRLAVVVLVAALLVLVGCGGDDGADDAAGSSGSPATTSAARTAPAAVEGSITVSAAASLTDAFTAIGDAFTAANPDAEVTFTFDSSSTLATQVLEGAPVDVFASADETSMATLTDEGRIAGAPVVFARNQLVIVTAPGNPAGITGLADLPDVGTVALCAEQAPCGRYAAEALDAAGVAIPEGSVTRGQNVSATLTAVSQGDAVAAVVYASDAVRAGDAVEAVAIPDDVNVVASYPIGVVVAAGDPAVAEAFVAFVLSPAGQALLEEAGFLPAP